MKHACTIDACRAASPAETIDRCLAAIASGDPNIWIRPLTAAEISVYVDALKDPETQPLYGVPFAIKDNIDLAGIPTTAGCPDYAYTPSVSAPVVQRLIDAGAIPIGKTNLDQFATGLVGVRSPYGVPGNAYDPAYIPGGSSSGSAIAVASGQVAFSLGTDTAGSGRIPAAFNNLVGVKPTRGILSTAGVVPACRSLDCVSIFANSLLDGQRLLEIAQTPDDADSWSRNAVRPGMPFPARPIIGIPRADQLHYFGNSEYPACFQAACDALSEHAEIIEIDASPLFETADLLYGGPWVAERTAAIETFLAEQPDSLHPTTRAIIGGGLKLPAVATYKAMYDLAILRQKADKLWQHIDAFLTPTAGTHYTIAEVEADPVQTNTNLGTYMNFMNLLDLSALAVPAGFTPGGMPFGVTLSAPAHRDMDLLQLAANWKQETLPTIPDGSVLLAVCGAHLHGYPLNHQLTDRGACLHLTTRTAATYSLYALDGTQPPKPGLLRVKEGGSAIEVEVWQLPAAEFGSFVDAIPAPLGIGKLELEDGRWVNGFCCDPSALGSATDISHHGSWRNYLPLA